MTEERRPDTKDRDTLGRDDFDRLLGALTGLPDVTEGKPTTVTTIQPIIGTSQTFVVRTWRQLERFERKGKKGEVKDVSRSLDTIFIECIRSDGGYRIALPPKVADTIARQREAHVSKSRSKAARANAAERKKGRKS